MSKHKRGTLTRIKKTIKKLKKKSSAFTLVEILVVIVIIGVLPLIVFIYSSGIRHNANVVLVMSDLDSASKQAKIFLSSNEKYPDTINCNQPDTDSNKCIQMNSSITYTYKVNNTVPKTFCFEASKDDITYSVNESNSPQSGPCPEVRLEVASDANGNSNNINGNKWKDTSGNSNNGSLENGAEYTASNGGAVGLDGVDDYVDVKYKLNENNGSISIWYYAKPWYQYQQIFDNDINPDDWEMWIDTNGVLHARIDDDFNVTYDLDNIYGSGHWYHITLSWKKSSNELKLYVNGSQRSSSNSGKWSSVGSDIYFGGGNSGNTRANGLIRSINVYSNKLSDDDIKSWFDKTKNNYGY